MKKNIFYLFFTVCLVYPGVSSLYANQVTIVYTGDTHAMAYPCNCPKSPDGGLGRRATMVNKLREDDPSILVLDSGRFFAGGLMDEYTQNTQLDKKRTIVNLNSMEIMGYDASCISDDEFNFGKEFLLENIKNTNLVFLSCNLQLNKIKPYLIKEIQDIKIGIIGVTTPEVLSKAQEVAFTDPQDAVKKAIGQLRRQKVQIVILLSQLSRSDNLQLIKEVEGIDIVITGSAPNQDPLTKVDSTLLLAPSWQGRSLDKLALIVQDGKIQDYKLERLPLSKEIPDDQRILFILPSCFSDLNCKKDNLSGICKHPGTKNAYCLVDRPQEVNLTVIIPKQCSICQTETVINFLKTQLPGLTISYLYYPDPESKKLIKDLEISGLPAYILGKEIEKEKAFDALKVNIEEKASMYILKPEFSGLSYLLNREKAKGRLDLFLSLYDKGSVELLEVIKDFNPFIHFLAVENVNEFDAAAGRAEVEEYLRAVCVDKYQPDSFWNYITCRAREIDSSWWDNCLPASAEKEKIKSCAQGEEGKMLLSENIRLNKELKIMFGPTYLIDNHWIFSSVGIPRQEDFRKIFDIKEEANN